MKEKYVVLESEGLWYKGKLYLQGKIVEMTTEMADSMKKDVKLRKATEAEISKTAELEKAAPETASKKNEETTDEEVV